MVAWGHGQVTESTGNLKLSKLAARDDRDIHEPACASSSGQRRCVGLPERDDHQQ